ncbi:MAG: hypothetical protein Q9N32_01645 [Gammaproteobacteria bacterium]|nr:hypothetical protein [Gammaproteobacteria bacterium]
MIPTPYLAQNFNQQVDGDGIAMGFDAVQLQRAKNTVHKVTENYQKLIVDCWVHVRCVVDIVELMLSKQSASFVVDDQQWVEASLDIISKTRGTLLDLPRKRSSAHDKLPVRIMPVNIRSRAVIMAERMHHNWHHQPYLFILLK